MVSSVYIIATLLTAVVLIWQYWRWTHKRLLELAATVPGPPAWPLVGNAFIFMSNPKELLDVVSTNIRRYGQYVRFWLGPELIICVKNPADIRALLTSGKVNQKGPVYDFMVPFIGPGILTGGPTWRQHRKLANPFYNKKSVFNYSSIFNLEADNLSQTLLKKDPSKTFNVYYDVVDATTQSVCQTLMGLSKEESLNIKNIKTVMQETQTLYSVIFRNMTRWWYQIPIVYRLIGAKKEENYYNRMIYEMTSDIVEKRRKALFNKPGELDTQEKEGVMEMEEGEEEVVGVVDRFILCGELSEQEIRWETFSLFTTSQEAAAKITSGLLLFLAHLPDWQEKVYDEIVQVLGPDDNDVQDEDLKKLRYLDMVYKEVLRYLAIAAIIARTVEEEITINDGKITLPAGTTLMIPIHDLHRDPLYWEQPNKVMPERFLPENVSRRDPNAFVPFSLGAMDCLGRVYATALIKTLAVKVLRQVVLEADGRLEDLEILVAISVRFANGYNLRCSPRKQKPKVN